MKVRFSPRSLAQIERIHDIAQDNKVAAANFLQRIEMLSVLLGSRPFIGRRTERPNVRIISVRGYPYLIAYAVLDHNNEVRILRVRHTARRPV